MCEGYSYSLSIYMSFARIDTQLFLSSVGALVFFSLSIKVCICHNLNKIKVNITGERNNLMNNTQLYYESFDVF